MRGSQVRQRVLATPNTIGSKLSALSRVQRPSQKRLAPATSPLPPRGEVKLLEACRGRTTTRQGRCHRAPHHLHRNELRAAQAEGLAKAARAKPTVAEYKVAVAFCVQGAEETTQLGQELIKALSKGKLVTKKQKDAALARYREAQAGDSLADTPLFMAD